MKHFVNIVDGYCTATVGFDAIADLAAFPGVMEIEGARFVRPTLDQSVDRMHGWDGMRGDANEVTRLGQGSGVLIGIVDYGLDFTLDDFRDPTSKDTRVEYLWDQQLTPIGQEISPAKYGYGVEYSALDIRRALAAPNPFEVVRHHPTNRIRTCPVTEPTWPALLPVMAVQATKRFPPGSSSGSPPAQSSYSFTSIGRPSLLELSPRGVRSRIPSILRMQSPTASKRPSS